MVVAVAETVKEVRSAVKEVITEETVRHVWPDEAVPPRAVSVCVRAVVILHAEPDSVVVATPHDSVTPHVAAHR